MLWICGACSLVEEEKDGEGRVGRGVNQLQNGSKRPDYVAQEAFTFPPFYNYLREKINSSAPLMH